MRWYRVRQIIWKEFIQLFRDKRIRIILFMPPLIQLIAYGYAANFDIKHVRTVIYDADISQDSRRFIDRFAHSRYFDVVAFVQNKKALTAAIVQGKATLGIYIHSRFAFYLHKGHPAPVEFILDGTGSNAAMVVIRYVNTIVEEFIKEHMQKRLAHLKINWIELRTRSWFNKNLISRHSFVPCIIAMLVLHAAIFLTSIAIAREKEAGTMEQLLVTPIQPVELILGKIIPYACIALFDVVLITLISIGWFHIGFKGNPLLLLGGLFSFLPPALGVGIFISTISRTQQQTRMAASFYFMPAILLSGFIFPIENMPKVVQYLTYLNPLRYFLVIVRGVFLQGADFYALYPQFLGLCILGVITLGLSVVKFRKRLD
ncbi:MAG: ABC transporter permease [Candidatus Desulfofervidaceae bacterium]|nr:ABC transporter permease [Candidatus Desulfofervidaceae bacterium]